MSALAEQVSSFKTFSSLDERYLEKREEQKKVSEASSGVDVVKIALGKYEFVVEVGVVVETVVYKTPIPLPRSFPWALGVIELRGEVLPLIDLLSFNKGESLKADRNSRMLIVRQEQTVFALLVSSVSAVMRVAEFESIQQQQLADSKLTFNKRVEFDKERLPFFDLKDLLNNQDFLNLTFEF